MSKLKSLSDIQPHSLFGFYDVINIINDYYKTKTKSIHPNSNPVITKVSVEDIHVNPKLLYTVRHLETNVLTHYNIDFLENRLYSKAGFLSCLKPFVEYEFNKREYMPPYKLFYLSLVDNRIDIVYNDKIKHGICKVETLEDAQRVFKRSLATDKLFYFRVDGHATFRGCESPRDTDINLAIGINCNEKNKGELIKSILDWKVDGRYVSIGRQSNGQLTRLCLVYPNPKESTLKQVCIWDDYTEKAANIILDNIEYLHI